MSDEAMAYSFLTYIVIIFLIAFIMGIINAITDHYLLKKIKAHPEQKDDLIANYWAKDLLDSDFYEKCKTPSEKLQQELEDVNAKAYAINDVIAMEKYGTLFEQHKKIDEQKAKIADAKRHQENNQKIEVLVNKASQALDDVWD